MSAAGEIWDAARMQAMAAELDARMARVVLGIQVLIDTTPVLPCGCRQGMCTGHALPPALPAAAARHEIRERDGVRQHLVNGAVCGCTAPPSAPPGAHGLTCPVFMQSTRAELYQQELKRLTDAEIAEAEPSGRPEKEGTPDIPLWDEAAHAALAEMSGPMTLPEDKLPAYDAVPPGCCTGCHLPVPAGEAQCFYCGLAEQQGYDAAAVPDAVLALTTRALPHCTCSICRSHREKEAVRRKACDHGGPGLRFARDGRCTRCGRFTPVLRKGERICGPARVRRNRDLRQGVTLLALGIVLFMLAVHVWPAFVFPAVLCAAMGLNGIRNRR